MVMNAPIGAAALASTGTAVVTVNVTSAPAAPGVACEGSNAHARGDGSVPHASDTGWSNDACVGSTLMRNVAGVPFGTVTVACASCSEKSAESTSRVSIDARPPVATKNGLPIALTRPS
jgi:hypothetical protein